MSLAVILVTAIATMMIMKGRGFSITPQSIAARVAPTKANIETLIIAGIVLITPEK
jgi:UPF0716 family protein affecting phage T7 exclusion